MAGSSRRRIRALVQQLTPQPASTRGIRKLLVANRGEIAIRIFRAAQELGISTVAIYADADKEALHTRSADESVLLEPSSYLNTSAVLAAAAKTGADAIHPGYGFLSEDAAFVRACEAAGLVFVGPTADTVDLFGDKTAARRLAASTGVPVLQGSEVPCNSPAEVRKAMLDLKMSFPIMMKAVGGGGGRGIREVLLDEELDEAFSRCASEASASFSNGAVFFEQLLPEAKHIEVQILGDGTGKCVHLFERDCSVQLRRQKVVEMAPARSIADGLRSQLHGHALRLAESCNYRGAGTFEFLVSGDHVAFIEGNPRIQVEHTVTEEAVGLDIVQAQLSIAAGRTLSELGLVQEHLHLNSYAIQARVTMTAAGRCGAYREPAGQGVRVDSACFAGCQPSSMYDPLLAKVIVRGPLRSLTGEDGFELTRQRLLRALGEFHIGGALRTNLERLRELVASVEFTENRITTAFLDKGGPLSAGTASDAHGTLSQRAELLDSSFGGSSTLVLGSQHAGESKKAPEGHEFITTAMQATIVSIDVVEGDVVSEGQGVAVVLSMKMEHVVKAACSGIVRKVEVKAGDSLKEGDVIALVEMGDNDGGRLQAEVGSSEADLEKIRPDLAEVLERHRLTTDAARLEHDPTFASKIKERHSRGLRSARENIEDLVDPGTFIEMGSLVVAQQRRRRAFQDLLEHTPADGVVAGTATVNADIFGGARTRTAVVAYDYTVLAGTQGMAGHLKQDRLIARAIQQELPMIFFCEGGGGRPGDTDFGGLQGPLNAPLWHELFKLSGLVPLVGLTSGYCFAGNAIILGGCDVVIATEGSNIGVGGPAMIEGGGLGVVRADEVGPLELHKKNGMVDVVVPHEAAAVAVARQYLSYFQGPLPASHQTGCADQRKMRQLVPESRVRVYEMRSVIETLVDTGSFLELRKYWGIGIITGLARVEGRSLGIMANNPFHLGGAIDGDGALKAVRFMKLCDAFGIPILSLCDTPGFMVGVDSEAEAPVRKASGMFVTSSTLSVPFFSIVTRKAYGLGAQAMVGGDFPGRNHFVVSWPTAEFGGMGLEGAVRLGQRKELEAARKVGPEEEKKVFDQALAAAYKNGKALPTGMMLMLDDVIDPAESRNIVAAQLRQFSAETPGRWIRRSPRVDTW